MTRQFPAMRSALRPRLATVSVICVAAVALAAAGWFAVRASGRAAAEDLLARYCVDCHNPIELTAGLAIDPRSLATVGTNAEHWEKVVRKLRAESMPPEDPRPASVAYAAAATYLETELDRAAAASPQAGDVPLFRRLTRTEYRNAIRDLLGVDHMPSELDFELLLPADNASSGFDNIADLLFVSPVVMERYIAAAQKIARLAVGDMRSPVMVNIHQLSEQLPQDHRVDELSFGTRGGLAATSWFPLDAEYSVDVELASPVREPYQIEVSIDGERASVASVGGALAERGVRAADRVTFQMAVSAGPHVVGVTFVERSEALDEGLVRRRMRSRGTMPAIAMTTIRGPYSATGPGDTPSRRKIFVCQPNAAADEEPCAREILSTLAKRAYRRAPAATDVAQLMPFYEAGKAEGGFEAGIQLALERLLVSPQFLYRIEREPEGEGTHSVSDVELASRLAFFLWSSIPDDELLQLAIDGRLRDASVLRTQVQRMLADPRSESMVTNFAAQWLFLRDVVAKEPDIFLFPDHDVSLRQALQRETELFVDSVLRGGGSVVDLLTAKHTFVNERLARHYGIANIRGSYFRRVELGDGSPRSGLLGQGSILTVTSYSTRTSPVLRGKYVLDNLLASPPPPPPPDVPALETEDGEGGAPLTMRDAMIKHRANPACAGCHAKMDPIGFALEHFDAVGRWRDDDAGKPIDTASDLADGSTVDGLAGVQALLLEKPELFVAALTEKLLMYATGRNVQYYDAPAVRAVVRSAAEKNYEFSAIVAGIVESVPFQMRTAQANAEPISASTAPSTSELSGDTR
jgi:mono/diheme cytochrome c family protein